jgi:hypothetical protein
MTNQRARPTRAPAPDPYYGYDPDRAYTLRSRIRTYSGTTERYVFANGQAIAYPMNPDTTEEQKQARCQRLGRLQPRAERWDPADSYHVYPYGTEPPPDLEPMWRGQADPTAVASGEDTGEATHMWAAAPELEPRAREPVEGPTPAGRTSNQLREALPVADRNTGEQRPPPPSQVEAPPAVKPWDRVPETS